MMTSSSGLTTIAIADSSGCGVGFSVSGGYLRGQTTSGSVIMTAISIGV